MGGHKRKKQGPGRPAYGGEHVPTDAEVAAALQKSKWGSTFLTQALKDAEKNVRITYLQNPGYFEMLDGLAELMYKANGYTRDSHPFPSSIIGDCPRFPPIRASISNLPVTNLL